MMTVREKLSLLLRKKLSEKETREFMQMLDQQNPELAEKIRRDTKK